MQQRYGHHFVDDGVQFNVWAPKCRSVEIEFQTGQQFRQLKKGTDGWFHLEVDDLVHSDLYRLRINETNVRPDPAANWFDGCVHGWNRLTDHRDFQWSDHHWNGIEKRDLIIYEMHVGTFTAQGTFKAAQKRIDELVELGITAIEILPVAQCPGNWNWGYDGVGLYAVQNTYGTPDDFKSLVDSCHQKGIAVILDVVFNHLGPEGNYLREFGPYFTRKTKTPWGDALNFDGKHSQHVREFMKQCATHWITNYRLDGLRLDAVHFMFDESELPISMEIAKSVEDLQLDRHVHLIGETNVRNASLTKGTSPHDTGFDAVWCDCMMHCVLDVAKPGLDLCHREHNGANDLAIAIEQGFLYEDFPYQRHDRRQRADLDSKVIGFQNHDTVGNHPLGLRIHQLASIDFQKAAAALCLLYPSIPMLFMGEEFAAEDPFLFFVDFKDPWVREGVERGRASEFPDLHRKLEGLSPLHRDAFENSKLSPWQDGNHEMRHWYRQLIETRKHFRASGLLEQQNLETQSRTDDGLFVLRYRSSELGSLTVAVRLNEPEREHEFDPITVSANGRTLLHSAGTVNAGENNGLSEEQHADIGPNEAIVFYDGKATKAASD